MHLKKIEPSSFLSPTHRQLNGKQSLKKKCNLYEKKIRSYWGNEEKKDINKREKKYQNRAL